MKRAIFGGVLVTAALVAVVAWVPGTVEAQDARVRLAEPQVHIVGSGGGSSIGVTVREVTADDAAKAKLDGLRGVWLETVHDATPASRAGLRTGDIVVEFDGERVRGVQQFTRLVRETPSGRNVSMAIVRDGARQTVTVSPEEHGARTLQDLLSRADRPVVRAPRNFSFDFDFPPEIGAFINPRQLGATLTPLGDQLRTYFGVSNGVLVSSVQSDSPASAAGVRAGDIITRVNGRSIDAPNDVTQAIRNASPGADVEITVMRDRKELTLRAKLPERGSQLRSRGVPI
jgi:S1-C subfamily serine protease